MKNLTILLVATAALVGCSSKSDDVAASTAKPGEGQAQNPTGKPQTPEAQAMDDKMRAGGQAQSQGQGSDAQKLSEALKKGGKP